MNIVEMQKTLAAAFGPSGRETGVAAVIRTMAEPFADEIYIDALGNLIVHKRGYGKKVMFSAHMDSIGVIVTHVDEQGFLRFGRVGGLPPLSLFGACLRFENGVKGIVGAVGPDDRPNGKDLKLDDLYLDIGAEDREDALRHVQVGDIAVYDGPCFAQGNRLVSPYLDDRIACVILLQALERIESPQNDLYFVFSAQEELGCRGAKTAAYAIDPEIGFAVDITRTGDTPECKPKMACKLGGGAAVKIMDAMVLCSPWVVEYLRREAGAAGIPHQSEVFMMGGTDASSIQMARAGVHVGAISIPTRYGHNLQAMCDLRDVQACVDLTVVAAAIG